MKSFTKDYFGKKILFEIINDDKTLIISDSQKSLVSISIENILKFIIGNEYNIKIELINLKKEISELKEINNHLQESLSFKK